MKNRSLDFSENLNRMTNSQNYKLNNAVCRIITVLSRGSEVLHIDSQYIRASFANNAMIHASLSPWLSTWEQHHTFNMKSMWELNQKPNHVPLRNQSLHDILIDGASIYERFLKTEWYTRRKFWQVLPHRWSSWAFPFIFQESLKRTLLPSLRKPSTSFRLLQSLLLCIRTSTSFWSNKSSRAPLEKLSSKFLPLSNW